MNLVNNIFIMNVTKFILALEIRNSTLTMHNDCSIPAWAHNADSKYRMDHNNSYSISQ